MNRLINFSCNVVLLLCLAFVSKAQQSIKLNYTNAHGLTMIGKAEKSTMFFHRLDTSAHKSIPRVIRSLATNSAGLAISFTTNSSSISAKWCTSKQATANNMTGIAYEGMDLYIKRDGRWQYAGVARPVSHDCSEAMIVENMMPGEKECLLFLPTYDEVLSLSVGVDQGAELRPGNNPFKKQILVYGSSIVQGASASRPGLAYPAKLSRESGYNFINLGFSGNAKLEASVADMIAAMPMDAIILDCVPNPSPEELLARTNYLISTIRRLHPKIPIVCIQSVAREKANFDTVVAARVALKDKYFKQEVNKLQKQDKDLYLIEADGLLGKDQEGTTDGIHPNDLGFDRMLQKIKPRILEILKLYQI
ncbi:SGNH/GDSL hydrolase family protein [uncultured Mucilaginibacter sp.]|uniref:SGNH/GDSL hydrolase family protein n=1 Tax=uncultured Mucilaginibacter sp. TaxID=797541 RepID=UPI0025ECAAB0|nr:SGNH/GDSL hydrolase family protein [uncultured Mucilaginibacter sp.]